MGAPVTLTATGAEVAPTALGAEVALEVQKPHVSRQPDANTEHLPFAALFAQSALKSTQGGDEGALAVVGAVVAPTTGVEVGG